jgi:hypothetical protein
VAGGVGIGVASKLTKGRVRHALVLHASVGTGIGGYAGVGLREYSTKLNAGPLAATVPASETGPTKTGAVVVGGSLAKGVEGDARDGQVNVRAAGLGVGLGKVRESLRGNIVIPLPGVWKSKALRRSERGLKLLDRAEAAHDAGKTEKAEQLLYKAGEQE